MQEWQAHEVEPGMALHHAAAVPGLSFGIEHGKLDPVKTGMKATAPDHIVDLYGTTILQQWVAVECTYYARGALNTGSCQITALHPDQWNRSRSGTALSFPTERGAYVQHVCEHEAEDQGLQQVATQEAFRAKWNLADIPARQPDLVAGGSRFQSNVSARIARPGQQHTTRPQLSDIPIVRGMHLEDSA